MNEINAVQLIIRKFLFAIKDLRKEDSAAGRWLDWLGDTLQYQDLMENLEPFGAEMLAEAKTFSLKKRLGGQLKAAKGSLIKEGNSNPTQEEIEERRMEMYGDEIITAAATHREAVDVVPDRESGRSGRTTGCNNSQVAPTSNAGDESSDAGNGAALKNATTCNLSKADVDTREDSLNVTDGSNAALLESGASANIYDQDANVSANSPAGAGVNLDSAHKFEARLRPGEGSTPEIDRQSASLPSPTSIKTDPKPTKKAKAEVKPEEQKYPHGEFENIMLTTREYTQLCERLDNADALIDEADGYFEAQPDKKRKYKSHYAMLLNWDRRRKEFEGVKPKKFKTAVDQDREEIKWLSDYYAKKERGENPPLPKIKMVGSA